MRFFDSMCSMNVEARRIIRVLELEMEWLREHVSSLTETLNTERDFSNNLENQMIQMQNDLGEAEENLKDTRVELDAVKQELKSVKVHMRNLQAALNTTRKEMNVSDKNLDNSHSFRNRNN